MFYIQTISNKWTNENIVLETYDKNIILEYLWKFKQKYVTNIIWSCIKYNIS
jgi:hypothetical protein